MIRVASIADSLTLLRRAPLRATQAHRFWSLPSRARQEEHEASWREEEAALFDAVAPNVAPPLLDAPAAALLAMDDGHHARAPNVGVDFVHATHLQRIDHAASGIDAKGLCFSHRK